MTPQMKGLLRKQEIPYLVNQVKKSRTQRSVFKRIFRQVILQQLKRNKT